MIRAAFPGNIFIQAATNDRVPCVFLENNIVVGLDPNDPLYVDYRKKVYISIP